MADQLIHAGNGELRLQPDRIQKSGGGISIATPNPALAFAMGYYASNTGEPVNPLTALQSATVYACVRTIAEDLARLNLTVRRRLPSGGYAVTTDHPLAQLLARPNEWMTRFDFVSYAIASLTLRGNAWIYIDRDGAGDPVRLIPIMPDRCCVLLNQRTGRFLYRLGHPLLNEDVTFETTDENVLHCKNMSLDGVYGLSPIACSQDGIGLALAGQRAAAVMFRQGSKLSGVLTTPGKLSPESAARMAEGWQAAYSGSHQFHRVAVLEEGLNFQPLSMTAEDSQLLESRSFSVLEVCRLFNVPPHRMAHLDDATFSNVEQMEMAYVSNCLMAVATKFEQALEAKLLFDDERGNIQFRFDFDALQRADYKTRMEAHQIGLLNGIFNLDEVRAKEDLPPLPNGEGKTYRVPLNTGPVSDTVTPPKPGKPDAPVQDEEPKPKRRRSTTRE